MINDITNAIHLALTDEFGKMNCVNGCNNYLSFQFLQKQGTLSKVFIIAIKDNYITLKALPHFHSYDLADPNSIPKLIAKIKELKQPHDLKIKSTN